MRPIRVLIADDHTLVRQGLVSLLTSSGKCDIVGEAADGVEAVEKAVETEPDVVILDISMPRLNGAEVVRRLRQDVPRSRILVLTMHEEEEYVTHMVSAGATGYLLKDSAARELLQAVEALASGEGYLTPAAAKVLADQYRFPDRSVEDPYGPLTPREREVFHLVVEGRTTKEIASELGISPKTAENHRSRMMEKLDLHSSAEVVRYAAKRGLL